MPSRGNDKHKFLIGEAIKKLGDRYKANLYSIMVEATTFEVSANFGFRYSDDKANKRYHPDIVAKTRDLTKKNEDGNWDIDKKIVVECENGVSTLTTGKPSIRNYGYKLFKEANKEIYIFILVTWSKYKEKMKNDLWDEVWYIDEKKVVKLKQK